MGIKLPVPDPTGNDLLLEKTGYETWYEHNSECDPKTGNPEDWKHEVLALIRLANFHKRQSDVAALSLRTLRDVGDEEVQKLFSQIWGALTPAGATLAEKLRDIAITRGQTRTDAVNKAAEWAKECEGLQEQLREAREEIERLQGYITVLNGGGPPNE